MTALVYKTIKIKRGGLLVEIKGSLLAFLPFSLISPEHYSTAEKKDLTKIMEVLQSLIGKILKVQIIELDIKNKRIILSEKGISHKEKKKEEKIDEQIIKEKKKNFLKKYKVGDLIEGKISKLTNFGLIIEFEEGLITGFLYSVEIPYGEQKSLENLFKIGENIKARITEIKDDQVYLSLKEEEFEEVVKI